MHESKYARTYLSPSPVISVQRIQQLGPEVQFCFCTLQVRMYCASRPKQPGFSFETLFPDDLFPPGNKAKGEDHMLGFCQRDSILRIEY